MAQPQREQPRPSIWERLSAPDTSKYEKACELTLLFYSPSPWDMKKSEQWLNLLGSIYYPEPIPSGEATTKVLCDAIRHALGT